MIAIVVRNAYIEDENHIVTNSTNYKILKKVKSPSCLILNYGAFLGSRHLQYMDAKEFESENDDTIWHSDDAILTCLQNGKAWIGYLTSNTLPESPVPCVTAAYMK